MLIKHVDERRDPKTTGTTSYFHITYTICIKIYLFIVDLNPTITIGIKLPEGISQSLHCNARLHEIVKGYIAFSCIFNSSC